MAFTPVFATGWETGHLGTGVLTYFKSGSGHYAVQSGGIGGSYYLRLANTVHTVSGQAYCDYSFSPSASELYVGVWAKPYSSGTKDPSGRVYVILEDGNSISLRSDRYGLSDTYYWHAYVGSTKVATGTVAATSSWAHLQLRVAVSNTGAIETKIDGISDIDYSGDTMPGTSNLANKARLWGGYGTYAYGYYFDNWVIGTGGWPGDIRFDAALVPDADTAQKDYTASTGTDNYAMVDEVPPSDSDYVWEDTNAGADLYNITDWDGTDKAPLMVAQWARMWKTEAAAHQQKLKLKSGATTSEETFDMLTTAQYYYRLFDNDPNTSAEWTDSAIDALQVGQEAIIV